MEPQNHSHNSTNTARLISADARHILEFVLAPLTDWEHRDWHAYEIHMIEVDHGRRTSLVSSDDNPIFLDRAIDPEIAAFCAGLRHAAATGTSYRFEPVDERDFSLHVATENRGIQVTLRFYGVQVSSDFGWPVGQIVDPGELVRFADDLESIYEYMIGKQTTTG